MPLSRSLLLVVLFAVAGLEPVLAAHGAAPPAEPPVPVDADARARIAATDRYLISVAVAAARTGEPRMWLLAARLYRGAVQKRDDVQPPLHDESETLDYRRQADGLVQRAWQPAMGDHVALWILATDCPGSRDVCRPDEALERLNDVDGDNLAARLLLLRHINAQADAAIADELIAQSVDAKRDTTYSRERLEDYRKALARVEVPKDVIAAAGPEADAEFVRAATALGLSNTDSVPSYLRLTERCAPEQMASVERRRRDSCLAIGRLMESRSDTVAGRIFGAQLLLRLDPGATETRQLVERQRTIQWLVSRSAQLARERATDPRALPTWLAQWLVDRREGGEVHAMRVALGRRNVPAEPPADWVPGRG